MSKYAYVEKYAYDFSSISSGKLYRYKRHVIAEAEACEFVGKKMTPKRQAQYDAVMAEWNRRYGK